MPDTDAGKPTEAVPFRSGQGDGPANTVIRDAPAGVGEDDRCGGTTSAGQETT
ncbi:hypothetical protein [Micromonospora arborensis]|uniref:hypothetical protein n=1 Tax=Micromonospora arborensis TaxID=2116518 RepID=UPI00142DD326|nr:hypothetical protein [Micromonospora arborensis]